MAKKVVNIVDMNSYFVSSRSFIKLGTKVGHCRKKTRCPHLLDDMAVF